jgi:hypothetical protein
MGWFGNLLAVKGIRMQGKILSRSKGALVATMFALAALGPPVHAASIHYDGALVTAIEALDVGGTLYNVDFEAISYTTFPGDIFFWAGDLGGASDAAVAINALLNTNVPVPNGSINNIGVSFYLIAWSGGFAVEGANSGPPPPADFFVFSTVTEPDPLALTAWSLTPVPVPAAVWLFGSALGLFGWMRRKTR